MRLYGNKALNRFNEMRPDLVLLDIGLPDMTGWQLLDYIREAWQSEYARCDYYHGLWRPG